MTYQLKKKRATDVLERGDRPACLPRPRHAMPKPSLQGTNSYDSPAVPFGGILWVLVHALPPHVPQHQNPFQL